MERDVDVAAARCRHDRQRGPAIVSPIEPDSWASAGLKAIGPNGFGVAAHAPAGILTWVNFVTFSAVQQTVR